MTLKTTPINPRFGVVVRDIDLSKVTRNNGYAAIREAFEEHSFLYFPEQTIDDQAHLRLGSLFGPREDRTIDPVHPDPEISMVSNVKSNGEVYQENERRLMDLKSNFLWHTDSTFLPVPALANILIGRTIPSSGSCTEFASTRIALEDMPVALRQRAEGIYLRHHYSHSRRKVDADLAEDIKFTHWGEQVWKSVWRNPVNNKEALYIASHAFGVVGLDEQEGQALIDELLAWCTRDDYVYIHHWRPGDVLIWDERAMLHRGRPWDYNQPRELSSICVSVRDIDGFDSMRYAG